ncbi:MAG: FadR family transcriptional regulator [Ilumatobacter sp.]|nr:FadR family transcriptional regulator [Ilumatobacter sp.]
MSQTTSDETGDAAPTGSNEGVTFEPVARRTVSTQIREQLLQRITTGELAPGARIPSERELSDQFRVARTSVREAIQGLLSLGVIERRGNRTCVAEHLPEINVEPNGDQRKSFVKELFETRRVLEGPVFALATERADDDARAAISELMRRFEPDLEIDEFRRLDREFHTTIAAQCGNPLLIELYGKVLDQLFRSHDFDTLLSDARNRSEVERIVARAIDDHRRIAAVFDSGDGAGMIEAATRHIDGIEHAMVDDLR